MLWGCNMMIFFPHFLLFFSPLHTRLRTRHSPSLTSSLKKTGKQQRDPWRKCRSSSWRTRSRGRNRTPGEEGSLSGLDSEMAYWQRTLLSWVDVSSGTKCIYWHRGGCDATCIFYFKKRTRKRAIKKSEHVCAFVWLQSSNSGELQIAGGGEWPDSSLRETGPPRRISITSDDLFFTSLPLPCLRSTAPPPPPSACSP